MGILHAFDDGDDSAQPNVLAGPLGADDRPWRHLRAESGWTDEPL